MMVKNRPFKLALSLMKLSKILKLRDKEEDLNDRNLIKNLLRLKKKLN